MQVCCAGCPGCVLHHHIHRMTPGMIRRDRRLRRSSPLLWTLEDILGAIATDEHVDGREED